MRLLALHHLISQAVAACLFFLTPHPCGCLLQPQPPSLFVISVPVAATLGRSRTRESRRQKSDRRKEQRERSREGSRMGQGTREPANQIHTPDAPTAASSSLSCITRSLSFSPSPQNFFLPILSHRHHPPPFHVPSTRNTRLDAPGYDSAVRTVAISRSWSTTCDI